MAVESDIVGLRVLETVVEPHWCWFLPSLSPHQFTNIQKTGTEPRLCFRGSWAWDKLRWVLAEWVKQTLQSSELGNSKDSLQKSIKAGLVILAAQESEEGESSFFSPTEWVQGQLSQHSETLPQNQKWLTAQHTPRFNPQYRSKQNKEKSPIHSRGLLVRVPIRLVWHCLRLTSSAQTPLRKLCVELLEDPGSTKAPRDEDWSRNGCLSEKKNLLLGFSFTWLPED